VEKWKLKLEHNRVIRDGFVACGNNPPSKPDPESSVVWVQLRVFKGSIFFPFIESKGHTTSEFSTCACNRR